MKSISRVVRLFFASACLCFALVNHSPAEAWRFGPLDERTDRLPVLRGGRDADTCRAEFSTDGGETWAAATIYPGESVDACRRKFTPVWNAATVEGVLPSGNEPCLWNHYFDVDRSTRSARFRVRDAATDKTVFETTVDFEPARDVFIIDSDNVADLAGGTLPEKWDLAPEVSRFETPDRGRWSFARPGELDNLPGKEKRCRRPSIRCTERTRHVPLVLKPKLKGWYRVYLGIPTYSTCLFSLAGDFPKMEIPSFLPESVDIIYHRVLSEYALGAFDLTGRDVVLTNGGCRSWQDVLVRYIRFVPMTDEEIARYQETRKLAEEKGRPFAGYVEPCTPSSYEPLGASTLREHLHNEMLLNKRRGSTDVYVHVLRLGSKAWYHSDAIERQLGKEGSNWNTWMRQGDPLAVAIEEGHAVGLKVFADVGMNSPYARLAERKMTEKFAREHPELFLKGHDLLDYRHAAVRDYAESIFDELLTNYDLDGVNLDFGRWGYAPQAYPKDALVDVVRRIDRRRKAAEKQRGHPILISARVDYAPPPKDANARPPATVAALAVWAQEGLLDRIMVNHDPARPKINPGELPLAHYVDAIRGTQTRLWGDLYGGVRCNWRGNCRWWPKEIAGQGPKADVELARRWVEKGVDGGFFYYIRYRPTPFESIQWKLRLIDYPDIVAEEDRF
jgi:hypothetical protein